MIADFEMAQFHVFDNHKREAVVEIEHPDQEFCAAFWLIHDEEQITLLPAQSPSPGTLEYTVFTAKNVLHPLKCHTSRTLYGFGQ